MVRVVTSNRSASSAARMTRGARPRSSSTSAYSRSVRFTTRERNNNPLLLTVRGESLVATHAHFSLAPTGHDSRAAETG